MGRKCLLLRVLAVRRPYALRRGRSAACPTKATPCLLVWRATWTGTGLAQGLHSRSLYVLNTVSVRSSVALIVAVFASVNFGFRMSHAAGVKWSNIGMLLGITLNAAPACFSRLVVEASATASFRIPPDDSVVPDAHGAFAELVLPPRLGLRPIVVLLRLGLVAGFSATSYALTRWGSEIDPPDGASLAYGHAVLAFSEATRNACR